jgi:hypothetical protein
MRRKIKLSLVGLAVGAQLVVVTQSSFPQAPQEERILEAIDNASYVELRGNVRPMFRPEKDLGPVEDSLKLENISLIFKFTESQQADLTVLLEEQQKPSSPNFHQWLTPEEFADRFGLSRKDINKVVAWLQAQGFQITQTARSRNWVSFSGTAAQAQAAFQTEIHHYLVNGQTYFANATEPSVPGALADVVLGLHGLDNYPPKPRGVFRQVKAEMSPNFTSGISGDTFVAPGDFAIIYDLNALYAGGIDGTGQSIAIVGQTDLYEGGSDITAFRAASGLPPNAPQVILIPGAKDPGVVSSDIPEASLDVEWSGAVARNATIIFVNGGSGGVVNAFQYAVDNNTAPVISTSYGACEADWGSTYLNELTQLGQEANAQGQTIVAAAGDSGAADCDSRSPSGSIVTQATKGLAVDAPASLPYVTGMGGSEFNEGPGAYWQAATNGVDVSPSALSYIPEMVWNDTSPTLGLAAGGGGASTQFTKPAWQTGPGVPNDNARDVPDLSLNASPMHDPALFCVQGSCYNGFRSTDETLTVAGGTSVAAPSFAGIVALINQQMKKRQGNINPTLYSMAPTSPAGFHDITTGNNIVPCEATTPDCPASPPYQFGYSAGIGYDQASGLGSIDAFNLVTAWGSPGTGNLLAPTLTSPVNGALGVALTPTFTWTAVAGNAGYRIMVASSPADLPTHPATSTCGACALVETTSTNSTSYTPSSALAAGAYYWQVQALEPSTSSGNAAWSNVFNFSTTGVTLPAPTLTGPANGATATSVQPTFTWTTVTGNAGYRILIARTQAALPTNPSVGTCGGGCTIDATTTAAEYVPAPGTLAGTTTFYWEVQALVPSGSGQYAAWSNVFSFTTAVPSFWLSASPGDVTVSPGSSQTTTLILNPVNGFSATPSFTCTPSSSLAGVTCSVGTYNPSTDSATVTITASSSAANFPRAQKNRPFAGWSVAAVGACLLLILLVTRRRRDSPSWLWKPRARQVALVALLACLLAVTLSCGGGAVPPAPPSETGIVTVQGVSGPVTASTTITVVVG